MPLSYVAPDQYVPDIIARAAAGQRGFCVVTDVYQCVMVHDNEEHRRRINQAIYVIPDSVILQRARGLRHGVPYIPTIRGADIMLRLCRAAATSGVPIGLIGGKDEAALAELRRRIADEFPDLVIAYSFSPPFREMTPAEEDLLLSGLTSSGARLVMVGLGCPKQEAWMAAHASRLDSLMIGLGAAFDFNAGIVKCSPPWVHQSGLEWLYRLISEPRRLWKRYLVTAPRFIRLVIIDSLWSGPQ